MIVYYWGHTNVRCLLELDEIKTKIVVLFDLLLFRFKCNGFQQKEIK